MKSKTTRHGLKRMTALLLAVVLCVGMVPTAFAAQQDSYHDPAENWQEANNRTNELDANATVTHETFNCKVCKQQTSFIVFRTPEYTRDGQTAMSRNVKYSDGTFVDGSGKGSILDGVPGEDAYYTAYHWTKAVCETCGSINTNMAKTDYGYLKNVYWLYDCANNFFEELPETQTIEQADSEYHRVITTSGEYCGFCYGTFKEESSTLERHHMESAIRPELAHDRFVEMDTCADCGYAFLLCAGRGHDSLSRLRGGRSAGGCDESERLHFFPHPGHRPHPAGLRRPPAGPVPQEPRPLPARQRHAHHRGRHCDHVYQGDPHPHHRLSGQSGRAHTASSRSLPTRR